MGILATGARAGRSPHHRHLPDPQERDPAFILLISGSAKCLEGRDGGDRRVFPVAINATAGVLQIRRSISTSAELQGEPLGHLQHHCAPWRTAFVMTGIKLGAGLALILIASRDGGAKSGLGYMIWSAWETFAVAKMYVGVHHRAHRLRISICCARSTRHASDGSGRMSVAANPAPRPDQDPHQHLTNGSAIWWRVDTCRSTIEEGTFFAIVGLPGCGKIRSCASRRARDRPPAAKPQSPTAPGRPQYSIIFQGDSIFPWMTVWDNALTGCACASPPGEGGIETAVKTGSSAPAHALTPSSIRISSRAHAPARSIARAFANTLRVLLMDEPFSALERAEPHHPATGAASIWETDKKTVVFITHSVDEAVTLADKIMVMTREPGRAKPHRRRARAPAQRARAANDPRYGRIVYGIWGHDVNQDRSERARAIGAFIEASTG